MTPEQFKRVEELFHELTDLSAEEQSTRLDSACEDDAEVRQEVESLLAQADPEETLQDLRSKFDVILRPRNGNELGGEAGQPAIEGYEIIRELHRGGQGVVYQAHQQSTKREVAIKVLLEGPYASEMSKRRFEREIELVASLNHRGIVAVFDSGLTSGKYWFAMDYIRGRPLDHFAGGKEQSIDDTLRLFAKVCKAVTYAHQHGVIHRDLKPGNILVDEQGEPHVLDFGLAKVADTEATGDSRPQLVSVTGQVMGTLPYMSPEQTKGDPHLIDIRTDVYSLGVILYELLTGKYPYEVVGQMADVFRNIAEAEPRKPSTIRRQINDEVETILLKALAKDTSRRYQSAGALAEDVHRFLAGEPIEAKRDSGWYVIRKQLRRYKLPVSVAAMFVLVLTAALVVSVSYWRQAESDRADAVLARENETTQRELAEQREQEAVEARADAQARADELEIVTEFQQSTLSEIDAEEMGRALFADLSARVRELLTAEDLSPDEVSSVVDGFDRTLRRANATDVALKLVDEQVLSRAVKTIETDFADQPLVRAALQQTVAETYREIGRYLRAMPLLKAALRTHRTELGDDHPNTLTSINNMGVLFCSMGKNEEAMPYFREAMEGNRRVLGDDHPNTLYSIDNMGALLRSAGKLDEARLLLVEAVNGARRSRPNGHWHLGAFLSSYGHCLADLKHHADAETALLEAYEILEAALGSEHKHTTKPVQSLADLYDAWHTAEPEAGHDAQAAEWRAKLETLRATTRPSTQQAGE